MLVQIVDHIYYKNVRWSSNNCKHCIICVEICPGMALMLRDHKIIEVGGCIRCELCERYCPDIAIEVIPQEKEAQA